MDKIFQFINDPANSKKIYILFVLIGLGFVGNLVKRVMNEIKRK